MHLLVVATSFPSPEYPYRAAFIGEQVRRLSDHVERITVISPTTYVPDFAKRSRAAAQASLPLRYELVKDRCEVLFPRYLKAPGQAFLRWTMAQWYRLVSKTVADLAQTRPISLIHANNGSVSSWSAIQVAKRYGIPCVVTYQGTEVHTTLANRQKGWKLCRDSFRLADLNISVSRSIERILMAYAQPQGRCEVLLRGVDLRTFFPSSTKDARRPIVLFVGRITEAKGVFDLLEAWGQVVARCPNAELWVVGPDHTNGSFIRETRSRGYGSSIRVSAPLPLPDVAELMRQAQVFCLPSHGEGTPNSVMEALASGLPVIATKVGGIPDIVESNRTGLLVQQGDVQGLAEALVSLLQDSDCRARMGEAAHEFARMHLDARKTVLRLVGLYRELITASRGNDKLAEM
jgi:glycosyltransferase involved in cell wall biosynthesis